MGLEKRGNSMYYYRKQRIGTRVVSVYCGRGEVAPLIHRVDEAKRHNLTMQHDETVPVIDKGEDQELFAICDEVGRMIDAAIMASGFHRHNRGKWRKRRAGVVNE